jgi:hypothetical protein
MKRKGNLLSGSEMQSILFDQQGRMHLPAVFKSFRLSTDCKLVQ